MHFFRLPSGVVEALSSVAMPGTELLSGVFGQVSSSQQEDNFITKAGKQSMVALAGQLCQEWAPG